MTKLLTVFLLLLSACDSGPVEVGDVSGDAGADVTLCDVLEVPPLSCVYDITPEADRADIVCAGATAGESWALPGDVCLLCPPRDPTQPAMSFGLQEFDGCPIASCAAEADGCAEVAP